MTAKTAGKVNADTEKLIRECGSGTKMAVKSIDEVLDGVVYDGVNGFRFQDADGLG